MKKFFSIFLSSCLLLIISCSSLTEEEKKEKIAQLYQEGQGFYQDGSDGKVLEKMKEAIKLNDEIAYLHTLKGLSLIRINEYKKATKAFDKSIDLEGDASEAYFFRALALKLRGKNSKYRKNINHYIQYNPTDPRGWEFRGSNHIDDAHFEDAAADYKKLLELTPKDPNVNLNLAKIYQALKENARSIEFFNKYVELTPDIDHSVISFTKGELYLETGNFQLALSEFLVLEQNGIVSPELFLNMGNAYSKLGEYKESIHYFNQYLNINPLDYAVLKNRGHDYILNGEQISGDKDLFKAAEINWNQKGFFYKYGWLLVLVFIVAVVSFSLFGSRTNEYDRKKIGTAYLFFLGGIFGFHNIYHEFYAKYTIQIVIVFVFFVSSSFGLISFYDNPNLLWLSIVTDKFTFIIFWSLIVLIFIDLLTLSYQTFYSNYLVRNSLKMNTLLDRDNEFKKLIINTQKSNKNLTYKISQKG